MVLLGRLQPRRPLLRWGAAFGVVGLLSLGNLHARESAPFPGSVPLSELPAQARETHRAIHAGGPFSYAKDGSAFGNRERLLPAEGHGYYREYTVATPGGRDRGARRIVCGGRVPQAPMACYYTGDHYISFKRIEK